MTKPINVSDPIIGIESYFFAFMVSGILILYAIMFYPIVKRSFKIKSQNRWNSLLVIILLVIIAIFLSLPFSATKIYLFMPLSFYFVVVVGSITVFFFIFAMFKKETSDEAAHNIQLSEGIDLTLQKSLIDTHNFTPKQEMMRKSIHLLAILYLATWMLVPLVFYGVQFSYAGIGNNHTYENYGNALLLFEDTDVEQILFNGLIVQFFMLLCLFAGNAHLELMRLRFKERGFIMKNTLQKTRRPTEINDISASVLLLLGLAISSLILTYFPYERIKGVYAVMAVICIAVFSDMFAALIGRKWGKHKWKIVPGKSYEGSIAGFLVGFFTAMIFVGPFLAFIGASIFVFTDIALDKVKICDNALNPILIAITFEIFILVNPNFVSPMIEMLPIIKIW